MDIIYLIAFWFAVCVCVEIAKAESEKQCKEE